MTTDVLAEVSLVAGADRIRAYAELTGDFNPLHLDPAFAATTEMGRPIAHGTLSLNLVWESLRRTFGDEGIAGASVDVRFRRPVFVDDTVTAGGERDADTGGWRVWVRNQSGEEVIAGTARVAPESPGAPAG